MKTGLWSTGVMACVMVASFESSPLVAQGAGSKTANLRVTAEVVANCVITVTDIAFGRYDPIAANATAPLDAQGSMDLRCTAGTGANVQFDDGQNAQGGGRRMASGQNFLPYQLWMNAAHSVAPPATGVPMMFTATTTNRMRIFGRIPPGQNAAIGSYQDTIVVTVRF